MQGVKQEKVVYALQTLITFLGVTKEGVGSERFPFKEQALDILAKLLADRDAQSAILQLNALIEQLNQVLKAPYPLFKDDTPENLVKTEIVAFEHYLNQELKINHLTIEQEAPLFNESLRLWENIGVSISAHEGLIQFKSLVERLNTLLPTNEHYPFPD